MVTERTNQKRQSLNRGFQIGLHRRLRRVRRFLHRVLRRHPRDPEGPHHVVSDDLESSQLLTIEDLRRQCSELYPLPGLTVSTHEAIPTKTNPYPSPPYAQQRPTDALYFFGDGFDTGNSLSKPNHVTQPLVSPGTVARLQEAINLGPHEERYVGEVGDEGGFLAAAATGGSLRRARVLGPDPHPEPASPAPFAAVSHRPPTRPPPEVTRRGGQDDIIKRVNNFHYTMPVTLTRNGVSDRPRRPRSDYNRHTDWHSRKDFSDTEGARRHRTQTSLEPQQSFSFRLERREHPDGTVFGIVNPANSLPAVPSGYSTWHSSPSDYRQQSHPPDRRPDRSASFSASSQQPLQSTSDVTSRHGNPGRGPSQRTLDRHKTAAPDVASARSTHWSAPDMTSSRSTKWQAPDMTSSRSTELRAPDVTSSRSTDWDAPFEAQFPNGEGPYEVSTFPRSRALERSPKRLGEVAATSPKPRPRVSIIFNLPFDIPESFI